MRNHMEGIYEMKSEDKFLRILFLTLYYLHLKWARKSQPDSIQQRMEAQQILRLVNHFLTQA